MHNAVPAPARLRMIVEGIDSLPTVTPALAALTEQISEIGMTPDLVHPVIGFLLQQATLLAGPSYGWSRKLAIELAAEQAEEYRQRGLAYQLHFLFHCLGCDPVAMAVCLYGVHRGETESVLQGLAISQPEQSPPPSMRTTWPQSRRRRPVS